MYGLRPSIPQNCLPYISMVLHTYNQNHFHHDAVFFTLFTNKKKGLCMIQLEHISKKFKKKTVLNDIFTHLSPEKFTVFMALTVPEKQCYSVSYPVWFSRLPAQ